MLRKMELAELVRVLLDEHKLMRDALDRVIAATERRDFQSASASLRDLVSVFKQHIEDEEAQLIRILVATLGRDGASEEIRVFQQHRPIYALMQKVSMLADLPPSELETYEAELKELFNSHTAAEEGEVFPRALECYRRPP